MYVHTYVYIIHIHTYINMYKDVISILVACYRSCKQLHINYYRNKKRETIPAALLIGLGSPCSPSSIKGDLDLPSTPPKRYRTDKNTMVTINIVFGIILRSRQSRTNRTFRTNCNLCIYSGIGTQHSEYFV